LRAQDIFFAFAQKFIDWWFFWVVSTRSRFADEVLAPSLDWYVLLNLMMS